MKCAPRLPGILCLAGLSFGLACSPGTNDAHQAATGGTSGAVVTGTGGGAGGGAAPGARDGGAPSGGDTATSMSLPPSGTGGQAGVVPGASFDGGAPINNSDANSDASGAVALSADANSGPQRRRADGRDGGHRRRSRRASRRRGRQRGQRSWPWVAASLGRQLAAPSVSFAGGTFTATVLYDDGLPHKRQDDSDGLLFVHQPVTGDATITARIDGWDRLHGWGGVGIGFRTSTDPLANEVTAAAVAGDSPSAHTFFRQQVSSSGAFGKDSGALKLPFWLQVERRGATFTARYSQAGTTFTTLHVLNASMGSTALVGLALWNRYYPAVVKVSDVRVTRP